MRQLLTPPLKTPDPHPGNCRIPIYNGKAKALQKEFASNPSAGPLASHFFMYVGLTKCEFYAIIYSSENGKINSERGDKDGTDGPRRMRWIRIGAGRSPVSDHFPCHDSYHGREYNIYVFALTSGGNRRGRAPRKRCLFLFSITRRCIGSRMHPLVQGLDKN